MRRYDEWRAGPFGHHGFDAFVVARDALVQGDALATAFPEGNRLLVDEFRRALLGAYLGVAEAGARFGGDRADRFREARGRAACAAALLEAFNTLGLVDKRSTEPVAVLLSRLYAMLGRLGSRSTATV